MNAAYEFLSRFLPLALVLAAGLIAARWPASSIDRWQRLGSSRWAPWIALNSRSPT